MPDASGANPLTAPPTIGTVADGVHIVGGMGNALSVETGDGVIQVDTGDQPAKAAGMIATLRELTGKPVTHIVYSHGHFGYNDAVEVWLAHNDERGDQAPRVIAHENLVRRQSRYRETEELQKLFVELQFQAPVGTLRDFSWALHPPTDTFADTFTIDGPGRAVEVLWAPSETDDSVAVWVPDVRLLYGGPATIPCFPNVGSPLRSLRDPVRWVATLERLRALDPALLVLEFGPVLDEPAAIDDFFDSVLRALRWLRHEVVTRLNRGMTADEIVADLEYPDEFREKWFLAPVYGHPDHAVRDIVRAETGWWDRNITNLRPAAPGAAAAAVLSAVSDRGAVLERARALVADGEHQLALHVVDLLALAPGDDAEVAEARTLKAEICRHLARGTPNFIEQSLYRSSARILDDPPVTRSGVR